MKDFTAKCVNGVKKFFKMEERGATFSKEILGGLTIFLTMAYILFVNPDMMTAFGAIDGLDPKAVFLATALAAGLTTLFMGLYANLPVALAPGMGLNAFFSFTVVMGMGRTWQEALAAVFVSGVLYLIIAVSGLRKYVTNAIPKSLKCAIGVGIGFFIAFVGLKGAGIIDADAGTAVTLGDFTNPAVLLALFGIALTLVLVTLNVKAGVFIGLIGTALVGFIIGLFGVEGMPEYSAIVSRAPSLAPTFGEAIKATPSLVTSIGGWAAIFAFLFVDFFDTAGTLITVTNNLPFVDEKSIDRANHVDAVGTVAGSILGTSTTTSYIESLSGIGAGARTGISALVVGLLFLLSIFFSPLMSFITSSVTAGALVVVGIMMSKSLKDIDWEDWTTAVPAFVTIIMMVLTYSISNGIGFGFLSYILVKLVSKKHKEISPVLYVVSALFLVYYIAITLVQ